MRTIVSPNLKRLFKYKTSIKEVWDIDREFSVYNPFTFTVFIVSFLFLGGLFYRPSFFLGLALLLTAVVSFFLLKKQSRLIFLKRVVPSRGVEYQKLKAKIEIKNNSSLPLNYYQLYDSFTGNQKGRLKLSPNQVIAKRKMRMIQLPWVADGGMGENVFKDLLIEIKDPLDLFSFYIHEDKSDPITIYPHYEKLPSLPVDFNEDSFHYGEWDVQKRGGSINFLGIRDYRKGDPVKRINWRQTARLGKPIVNVFERNVNKSIIFLFNNSLSLHSGMGALSTLEYCRDLILSMASEHISNGNQLKIITKDKETPWGAERSFVNHLERFLIDLKLVPDSKPQSFIQEALFKADKNGIKNSSLIYFTPLIGNPDMEKVFQDILQAKAIGIPFKVIGIDPYAFVDSYFHFGSFSGLKGHIAAVEKLVTKWRPIFRQNQIPFLVLKVDSKSTLFQKLNRAWRENERKI